jgi:ribosomal protein L7Ae-like RNA K-turn-binding protein
MVRLVRDPDGVVQIDARHKLPGRGAYLHLRRACVVEALGKRALQRSFRAKATLDGDADALYARMAAAATRRALERLGLARRAGAVAMGTEAVRQAMKTNLAQLVWLATDASAATRTQIEANCERKGIARVTVLDGHQLARAVGMTYLSAIAVTGEPFASELTVLSGSLAESALGASSR